MSDLNGAPKTSEDYNVNLAFSGDVDVSSSYGTAITGGGGGGGGSSQPRVVNTEEGGGDDERGQWDNKCDFFLSALGYAVGLGNVWRFPYLAYKYGGGSFLLPYTFMLFFAGLPLFFLELALGQYSGAGPTRLFGRMAPIMKGLGFSMLLATFFVSIYYNVIIAWTLHYLFSGMAATLPWTDCSTFNSTWRCQDAANTTTINNVTTCEFDEFFLACRAAANGQGNETLGNNGGVVFPRPRSLDFDLSTCSAKVDLNSTAERCFSPPEDYFNSHVLGIDLGKDGHTWENMGGMQWPLVGCLFAAWTIVCLCLIKGVQSSGKVVYFTALFPFAVLIILFFRGIFLEGAIDGVKYYLTPRLDELQNGEAWQAAATQIFYSLGPAFGGLITLSSYNKFDNNCHRDAVLIAFCNCGTSVFAGIVVFSILGFMAETSGVPIEKVAEGGPGLAFVVFPEAIAQMGGAQFWSFLFFTMLITLGLDSMFTFVECMVTALHDHFKFLRKYKELTVVGVCVTCFLFGLSMVSQGGIYMFTLIDSTCASWNILLFALLEVFLVSWMYGMDKWIENLEEMGMKLWGPIKWYWIICWQVITPGILVVLLVQQFSSGFNVKYGDYRFPDNIQGLGWLLAISSVAMLPLLAVRQIIKRYRGGKKLGFALYKATSKWRPASKAA